MNVPTSSIALATRTMTRSVASLFFFCLLVLLLPAQHGASSYASYKLGSRQIYLKKTPARSSGDSQQASTVPPETTCSSTGLGDNKLPIVHWQSQCSPLHGLPSLTVADVLRRDASLIRRRFSSQSSLVAAPARLPAGTTVPVNGSSHAATLPGAPVYSVLVGYGTPEQQFPVLLDTSFGTSVLRCTPCASGSGNCSGPAFDTSRSSTFTHVPCGSPDCPTNCSSGSICPSDKVYPFIKGTSFAEDVLTLAPTMAVDEFIFVCLNRGQPWDLPEVGTLDLSRNRNSLPSRLDPAATSFSYCVPRSPRSKGFLYLGGNATSREDNRTAVHTSLLWNNDPELASMYFIDLVGISLGDEDLPIPAGTFGGSASTNLAVGFTFTMLAPDVYTLLRDSFQRQMSQYSNLSLPGGIDGFDTCFNFTGLHELTLPLVEFKFRNSKRLLIEVEQMLYYQHREPYVGAFTTVCLAFSSLDVGHDVVSAVIGAYTLASTEVVYDVAGGEVAFIPWSC